MSDAAQPLLSYSAWRAEAARISTIAQSVAADEHLASLLTAVMPAGGASALAATPAAPTSFFSQLFASAAAPDAARGVPWCASLAHLLALAELPPALTAETSSQESATTTAPHPLSSARRHLSRIIAAVAACSDNNTPHATAAAARTEPTLASSSHALMPTLTTSPASSHDTTFHTTSLAERTTAEGSHGNNTAVVSRVSVYDDRDDAEDDGGFDRMFARLKQQAVERRQQQQQQQQKSSTRRTTDTGATPTTAAAPLPPQLRRASTDANTTSSGGVAAPSITLAGQQAARAAMDAADALLLRARQQNQLSTTPSGRIVEAETVLLHAAVCEESIVYTDRILHAVRTLLEREGGYQVARRESEDGMRRRPSTLSASRDTTDTSQAEDDSCASSHAWAAAVASSSPRRLTGLLRSSTAARMSGSFAASSHGLDSSFDHRLRSSMSASSAAVGGPSRVASPVGAPATMLAASASASPASAASAHFYRASPTATFAAAAARPRLPHELVALLAQWRQLTEAQQRSVRCAEVHDYVHAGRLFLGAAAERAQLGCDATPTGKKEKAEGLVCGPAAELAAHGVTHLLRACGVLLADPLLEQDVVYPPSLLEEVTVAVAAAAKEDSALDAAVVIPPPLIATPHAPRVWLLLSQLAGFVERHRLELPWDTPASQHRGTSGLKSSSVTPLHTPIALPRGPTSTIQMLWEVAAAALLCRTEDALRIINAAVTHTTITSAAAATSTSPRQASHSFISLHDLLAQSLERGKEVRPVVRPVVQPGTLPLCLHALRHASAAAVWSKHYAEALRNAELALLLLDDAFTQWNTEGGGSGADDAATMNQKKKMIDYRKVARWSTVTGAATCVPSLAWLEARVHFYLLRLLLLLLSAPLTAGDAVTRLLRQSELMRPLSTKRTATEGEEEGGGAAAKQDESDAVGEPMRSSSKSNSSSSDVHAQYVPPGHCVSEPSAVAEVATVLQQTLDALQRIGDEIRVVESESGGMAVVLDDRDGRDGEGQQQQRAVLACMPLPRPAQRLSAALSTGDEAVDADGIATSSAGDAAHSSTVVLSDEATLAFATTAARRVTCRLPSSSCYQRLKQKYQGTESQQKEVRSLFSTTPSDVAQENIASPLQQPSPSVVACETSTPDGDDDAQTTPAPLSHAMTQLHEVMRDVLVVVCLLTMPLRARSTNTITADTLLPASFCGGKVREESTGEERGYDRQCTHARHALNEVEGRLERCLRRLGARDRILFTLLRRLRVELLFPAACGPLV